VKPPAFQFYPGDWRRDTGLRACSLEARGLWLELMCVMHDGEPYGYLAIAGVALTDEQTASIVGLALPRYRRLLGELLRFGVPSRDDAGLLYSRRMVRDQAIREVRAAGGSQSLKNPNVPRPKANPKGHKKGRSEGYPSPPSFEGSPAVAVASAGITPKPPLAVGADRDAVGRAAASGGDSEPTATEREATAARFRALVAQAGVQAAPTPEQLTPERLAAIQAKREQYRQAAAEKKATNGQMG
jgi:hypothetical protein